MSAGPHPATTPSDADPPPVARRPGVVHRRLHRPGLPAVLAAAAWPAAAVCVAAVVLGADRGLDLTDESSYLLAARPWAGTSAFTSLFGWYLGPWLRVLGDDVTLLRVSAAVLLAAAAATTGDAARRAATVATGTPVPGGALLPPACVAAAAAFYGFFLRTPGYGWFAATGTLLVAAGVLRLAVERTARPLLPVALPLGAGLAGTAVGKVTTAAVAGLVVLAVGVGVRAWRRLAVTGGVLAAAVVVHLTLVASAGQTLAVLRRSREMAATVDPEHYSTAALPGVTFHGVLDVVTVEHSPVALLALLPLVLLLPWPARGAGWVPTALAVLPGLLVPAALLATASAPGPRDAARVGVVAAGTALVLALATARRPGPARRVLSALLAVDVLALAYVVGTNNPALWQTAGAVGVLVAGAGLGLAVVAGGRLRVVLLVALTVAAVVAGLVPVAAVRADHPYRTRPLAEEQVPVQVVPGTPALRVDPGLAQWAAGLRAGAAAGGWRPGTPLFDLSWHPGAVLVLDGRAPSVLLPAFPQLRSFAASARLAMSFEAGTPQGRAVWHDTWLVVPVRARGAAPSPAVASAADAVVEQVGRRFPAGYACVAEVVAPFDGRVQTLWRPVEAGGPGPGRVGCAGVPSPTLVP